MAEQANCIQLIEEYYKDKNYLIKTSDCSGPVCYVFFSSLGLYGFDDAEALQYVHDNERYEWLSISSSTKVLKNSCKLIFLRDLNKVFYQRGINYKLNNIEQIADFINLEAKGRPVYLVGSSAGGYISLLLSKMVENVKRVYSLGGCVDLMLHSSYYESAFFKEFNPKYSSVFDYISRDSLIVHFYGSRNDYDLKCVDMLKHTDFDNIVYVPLISEKHAPRPSGVDLIELLTCSDGHLMRVSKRLRKKKEISSRKFSLINLGLFKGLMVCLKSWVKQK